MLKSFPQQQAKLMLEALKAIPGIDLGDLESIQRSQPGSCRAPNFCHGRKPTQAILTLKNDASAVAWRKRWESIERAIIAANPSIAWLKIRSAEGLSFQTWRTPRADAMHVFQTYTLPN